MQRLLVMMLCLFITACGSGGGGGGDSSANSFAGNWLESNSLSTTKVSLTSSDSINYTGTIEYNHFSIPLYIKADLSGQFPQTIPGPGQSVKFTPTISNIVTTGSPMYNNTFRIMFQSKEPPYNPTVPFNLYSELYIILGVDGYSFSIVPSYNTMTRK